MSSLATSISRAAVLSCATVALIAQTPPASQTRRSAPSRKAAATSADSGERVFQANCSRCHNPPESLSPRITGTVVRHMRVRANLTAEEERLILGYLNP